MMNFTDVVFTAKGVHQRYFDIITKLLIIFSFYIIGKRLFYIATTDGWSDRADFFVDGVMAPVFSDFILNEVILSFFLIYIVIVGVKPVLILIFLAASLAYFNRSPLILMFCALLFSPNVSFQKKIIYGIAFFLASLFILYLRIGNDLFDFGKFSFFILTYPVVGIGRLLISDVSDSVNFFHVISLLLKPLDSVFFIVDYSFNLAGEISAARFTGLELSTFRYIPFLDNSFNAFGTVVFPFIYIFGWFFGTMLFFMFLVANYFLYRISLNSATSAKRLIFMFLLSGILFSWASPFIWVLPFFFPSHKKYRLNRE